mmetsp:Transcript_150597/g.266348  ORF Transcript_150597/g.266348 Transcript_150597/m.266348 type:complete len:430 (-) Transcript_150597:31-1320(-)
MEMETSPSSPLSRPGRRSWTLNENAAFTEVATVVGIWLLTIFVAVHTLSSMRTILVPLFWAFFLMMGLVPATDFLERLLLRCCGISKKASVTPSPSDYEKVEAGNGDEVVSLQSAERIELEVEVTWCEFAIRTIAVLVVAGIFLGLVLLFFIMIYISAMHMRQNFEHYQEGAKRLTDKLETALKLAHRYVPRSVLDKISSKALIGVEDVMSAVLGYILEGVTGTLVEGLMMLLYMLFWLCQPMHVSQNVSVLFKQYIMLKALASGGYAFCVWLLLHTMGIDLAIVFGLITFLFNFVPEVGPFIAIVLPLPIMLFDARIKHPLLTLGIVFGGNLILKCLWANVIEVKLVESQEEMRMHPVVILFFVAFFGWLWGPTGMLLSVPAMAVLKASMDLFPKKYRDPILITLEGDRLAPKRFTQSRMQSSSKQSQ